jgi:hypothetical protein
VTGLSITAVTESALRFEDNQLKGAGLRNAGLIDSEMEVSPRK